MKKKIMAVLLSAGMAVTALAGCGNTQTAATGSEVEAESETGEGLIGVCMQNMSSSISVLESDALKETFGPMGYNVSVQDAGDDVSKQKTQIQNFITQGAKMIVVLPCEIEAIEDDLIDARDAGIKVVISGGTGTISEEAYDAVSADDEFLIGMWVASLTKTWVETNKSADDDWELIFVDSSISEDSISRCKGEKMLIQEYLVNEDGEYVDADMQVVDEENKVKNPVYCEIAARKVEEQGGLKESCIEMSVTGDMSNSQLVANIMAEHPKARVFVAYNSLLSTDGGQYIVDNYESELDDFGFFSGGVMGSEYQYLAGSVSDDDYATKSAFRGGVQFGGGDAAATLANLALAVLTGEEGVDYFKTNPNDIGIYYPIRADENDGVPALIFMTVPHAIGFYTVEDLKADPAIMTYWDEVNGENPDIGAAATTDAMGDPQDLGAPEGAAGGAANTYGTGYTYEYEGFAGTETAELDVNEEEGLVYFYLPGNAMVTDVYSSTYTLADGVMTIDGFTNIDASSEYKIPGLWDFIDGASGAATFSIDEAAGTFAPVE